MDIMVSSGSSWAVGGTGVLKFFFFFFAKRETKFVCCDADADADEDDEEAEDAEGVLDVFEAGYEDDIVEEEERAREGGALIQDDDKPSKEAAKQNLLEKASDPEKNLKVHRDRQLDSAHEVAAHHIAWSSFMCVQGTAVDREVVSAACSTNLKY